MATGTATDIVIGNETYSLLSQPKESSALVCNEKKHLLGSIDLEQLVKYLGHVGSFIRLAYNGVGAAGPKFQDLQIEIQRLGYDITKLCDKSAVTVASFESTSKIVLSELKATYQYLLDGFEDMAIVSFSSLAELAGKMATAAQDLQIEFEKQAEKVISTLEITQREKATQSIRIKDLQREKDKMKHQKEAEQQLVEEHSRLEQEARKERLYYEHKEDKALRKSNSGLRVVATVVTSVFLSSTPQVGYAIDEILKDSEDSKAAVANRWKQKSLQKLEVEKSYRKLRHEGLKKMAEFTYEIEQLQTEGNISEAAIGALHGATGALKHLSVIMMQAALFWLQLSNHCERLARKEFKEELNNALANYSDKKKKKYFESNGFKEKAVTYYAHWVALYSVCHEYRLQMQVTQQDLYKYLMENPTYEESKYQLQELSEEFSKILKMAQEEIERKDLEAAEQMKMLQN